MYYGQFLDVEPSKICPVTNMAAICQNGRIRLLLYPLFAATIYFEMGNSI